MEVVYGLSFMLAGSVAFLVALCWLSKRHTMLVTCTIIDKHEINDGYCIVVNGKIEPIREKFEKKIRVSSDEYKNFCVSDFIRCYVTYNGFGISNIEVI